MTDEQEDVTQMFCVDKTVITAEKLRELSIRVMAEENFDGKAVWMITKNGMAKMVRAGFTKGAETAGPYHGVIYVAFTAPAATAAPVAGTATAAPATTAAAPAAPAPGEFQVKHRHYQGCENDGYKAKLIKAVEEILVPFVKKNVDIWVPHDDVHAPRPEGAFCIWIRSSPEAGGGHGLQTPETMWGIKVDCRDPSCFAEWSTGLSLLTTEGNEVGSCDKNNLFIYHDLVEKGTDNEVAIFRKMLEATVKCIRDGVSAAPIEVRRNQYVSLCGERIKKQREQAVKQLAGGKEKVEQHQRALVEELRNLRQAEILVSGLGKAGDEDNKRFGDEFDALRGMETVTDVVFKGTKLVIHTNTLHVIDPRSKLKHEVGKCAITIDTTSGAVTVANKTRLIDGMNPKMHAPHVFPNGGPCFGSIANTIPQLVAAYEFSTAAQIMIAYLTECNVADSAGWFVHRWPLVKDNGEAETAQETLKRIPVYEKSLDGGAERRHNAAAVRDAQGNLVAGNT